MIRHDFDHGWRFHPGDPPGVPWRDPDESTWRLLDLPHDWSIELERKPDAPSKASGGYFQMGRGWYRKTFEAPETWSGKHVLIEFEGVYMNAEVWLNGNLLGRHPYGYTSFHYDLTPYLKLGAKNVLQVSVDNDCQLNSRWYSGSGIYRHVWLLVAEPVHVAPWGTYVTTPEVTAEQATVSVDTDVVNGGDRPQVVTLWLHIVTPEGVIQASGEASASIEPGEHLTFTQALVLPTPRLWNPDTPSLYSLETEVVVGDTVRSDAVADTATTTFGIRTLAFDAANGFLLNGKPTLLRGGCVHHDNGVLGAASYDRAEERKVELLKASGYNAVRCAHNPPAPAFLDACDRLGILVMDEAFDCWREGKNPYDYHTSFPDWWQRDLDSMVLRDRNHPSVIIWSIGNEVGERDGTSDGAEWAHRLAGHIRTLDPTRPVTSAINGFGVGHDTRWVNTDPVFAALDVCGYNYQDRQYRSDHARHPDRIMCGTESTAREACQHWLSVKELPYVIGDFVWTSLDYLGEAGIGRTHFDATLTSFLGDYPWNQANCGDIDLCGFKRPQSHYRDILWGTGEKLYIAVHDPVPEGKEPNLTYWAWPEVWPNWTWPGREGEAFKVDVYSACEEVELQLNGASLGTRPTGRDQEFIATFDVPYAPGVVQAIGFKDGQRVAEWSINTVDAPISIRLTPDRDTLMAAIDDLCYIAVEIVDASGRTHPAADDALLFTVSGAGTLAAVGSANPATDESYRGNQRRAYRGRCLIVVKAGEEAGEIHVHAEAAAGAGPIDLAPAEVAIGVIDPG